MPDVNKADLLTSIAADINDNLGGEISAADVRTNVTDIVDSIEHIYASGADPHVQRRFRALDDVTVSGVLDAKNFYADHGTVMIGSGAYPDAGLQIKEPWNLKEGTTAIGYFALNALASGNDNGDRNSAVGFMSQSTLTTGSDNTSLGFNSLLNTTTGSNNVALGKDAGKAAITSWSGVYIGYQAGFGATGHGNVFIGPEAGKTNTDNNKLIIGNDNSADPLMSGDFETGLVAFRTKLSVPSITSPSVAKAWLNFDASTSVPTVNSSHNIRSIVDHGTGKFVVNISSGVLNSDNFMAFGQSNFRSTATSLEDFERGTVGLTLRDLISAGSGVSFAILNNDGNYTDAKLNDLVVYGEGL